jgi:hypothetical protein
MLNLFQHPFRHATDAVPQKSSPERGGGPRSGGGAVTQGPKFASSIEPPPSRLRRATSPFRGGLEIEAVLHANPSLRSESALSNR